VGNLASPNERRCDIIDNINKLTDEQYFMHCVKCLTTRNLTMYPHRRDGKIVGWVFVCLQCEDKVSGKEINLNF
jgi:hypothetical protein